MLAVLIAILQADSLAVPLWLIVALFGALLGALGFIGKGHVRYRDIVRDVHLLLHGNGKSRGLVERIEEKFTQFDHAMVQLQRVSNTVEGMEARVMRAQSIAEEKAAQQAISFSLREAELKALFREYDLKMKRPGA
jgi:hypothetical protein